MARAWQWVVGLSATILGPFAGAAGVVDAALADPLPSGPGLATPLELTLDYSLVGEAGCGGGSELGGPSVEGEIGEWSFVPGGGEGVPVAPWLGLAGDDAGIFGRPRVNVYLTCRGEGDDVQGRALDVGVKHAFRLADWGWAGTPVVKDLAIVPGVVFGIEDPNGGRLGGTAGGTHLTSVDYGVSVVYDLNRVLWIARGRGTFFVKGFVAYRSRMDDGGGRGEFPSLRDEFYGGVGFGWRW